MAGQRQFSLKRKLIPLSVATIGLFIIIKTSFSEPERIHSAPETTGNLAVHLQNLFSELADLIRPTVVSIGSSEILNPHSELRRNSLGSGVIIDPRGYILTNDHVVGSGNDLKVTLWNNKKLSAHVVQRDKSMDIALIKIDLNLPNLVAASMGNSDAILAGHWVIAVGNPFGLSHTVSVGIVSAVGRSDIGILPQESFIQTDASIHQGNSGGPLVNLQGEVIGINTAIYSNSGGANLGIGFAIPINLAKVLTSKWINGKNAAFLGIETTKVDDDMAAYYNMEQPMGAFIDSVIEDSPASKAGLKVKDILLKFNGAKVRNTDHLRMLIAESETNSGVPLEVQRLNTRIKLMANLTQRQSNPDRSAQTTQSQLDSLSKDKEVLGIEVNPINNATAKQLGLPLDSKGIVVLGVVFGSPADSKGILVGDIIVETNDVPVENMKEFRDALARSNRGVMLKIVRNGRPLGYIFLKR